MSSGKEHPILFSAPMVRALLDGRKTQTRRIVKLQRGDDCFVMQDPGAGKGWWPYRSTDGASGNVDGMEYPYKSPYGEPGEHIWVKERYVAFGCWRKRFNEKKRREEWHFADLTIERGFAYRYAGADTGARRDAIQNPAWHNRTSLFMPRAASRITLEVVAVRAEQLQDISELDARAEGVTIKSRHTDGHCAGDECLPPSIRAYRELWAQINGADAWDANPWVWVVEFKRIGASGATQ